MGDEAAAVSCLLSESKKLKSDQKKEIMDMQVQESERKQIALCENDMSHMRQLNLSDNDMIERAYEKLDEIEIDTYDSAICSEEEDDSLSSQEVYDLMTSNPAGPVRRSSRTKNHKSYQEESDTEESEVASTISYVYAIVFATMHRLNQSNMAFYIPNLNLIGE